jgi:hypothetical protein
MHVQAKVGTTGSAFADEDGDENNKATSATYRPGAVLGILDILQREGFNLRTATGQRIELGGEFGFTVDPRNDGEDYETATTAAVDILRGEGFDAHVVEVQVRFLSDVAGALRDFVSSVSGQGLLIEDIAVGTPSEAGIPVQIFTVRAG